MPSNQICINGNTNFEVPDSNMVSVLAILKLAGIPVKGRSKLIVLEQEWFHEIVPHGFPITEYIRIIEGPKSLHESERLEIKVVYELFTQRYKYTIVAVDRAADEGNLRCGVSVRTPEAGENHTRGHDLHDGPFNRAGWKTITDDILRNEVVHLFESPLSKTDTEEKGLQASWTLPEHIDLDGVIAISENILSQVSVYVAMNYKVIPIDVCEGVLTLVIRDSGEAYEYDELRFIMNRELRFIVATEEQIDRAFARFYHDPEETAVLPKGEPLTEKPFESPDADDVMQETVGPGDPEDVEAEDKPPVDPERPNPRRFA